MVDANTAALYREMDLQDAADVRQAEMESMFPLESFQDEAEANIHKDCGFNDFMEKNCCHTCIELAELHYSFDASRIEQLIKLTAEYGMWRELWLHQEKVRLQKKRIEQELLP